MLFLGPKGEYKFRISTWPYTQLDLTLGREATPSTNADQPDHLEIVDVVRDDILTICSRRTACATWLLRFPNTKPGSPKY